MRQQVIDESGLSTTDINDCRTSGRDSFDESKRSLKVRAVPTDRIRRFFRVNLFPVGLSVHERSPPSDICCLDDTTRCNSRWSTIQRSLRFSWNRHVLLQRARLSSSRQPTWQPEA